MILPASGWLDWYHARHNDRARATGNEFEAYVEQVMTYRYPDNYMNPRPAGFLGDGGCDGVMDMGKWVFACFGTRALGERHLAEKIGTDFARAADEWPEMERWTFVTNAQAGPIAIKKIHDLQQVHDSDSDRPIKIVSWNESRLWVEVVSRLPIDELNAIFPGVPGAVNIELQDLLPLLAELVSGHSNDDVDPLDDLAEIPLSKLDYNGIPADCRVELNSGRRMSASIKRWFLANADPLIEDVAAANFRRIYSRQVEITSNPREIMERLYVSLGGSDVRFDSRRAEAVFAVSAYFFDLCHIFERTPNDWDGNTTYWDQQSSGSGV